MFKSSAFSSTAPSLNGFTSLRRPKTNVIGEIACPSISGRWRHFLANGNDRIQPLLDEWRQTTAPIEIARRLIDLFVVSVLLDAGAGPDWKYREHGDNMGVSCLHLVVLVGVVHLLLCIDIQIGRSEGLAVASLDMVKQGLFSGIADLQPFRVDGKSTFMIVVSACSARKSNLNIGRCDVYL